MTLKKQYLEGKSLRDLAKENNVSHIAIRNILLKNGTTLRKHGENTKETIDRVQAKIKIKRKEINKKISISNSGKRNGNWKNGWVSTDIKIKNKIFEKHKGVCQDCKKQLFRGKKGVWEAHHLDTTLKNTNEKEYHLTEERVLLCLICHRKRHPEVNEKRSIKMKGRMKSKSMNPKGMNQSI